MMYECRRRDGVQYVASIVIYWKNRTSSRVGLRSLCTRFNPPPGGLCLGLCESERFNARVLRFEYLVEYWTETGI